VLGVACAFALLVALVARFEYWRVERQQQRVVAAQASELDRQLAQLAVVPRLLVDDPRIVAALSDDGAASRQIADRLLEKVQTHSGAAFVFLMDAGGTTVAASNWRDPLSFVGVNYGYRPYFRGAIAGRETTFFAIGATTGEPGYFVADPVLAGERALGVVVLKVSLEALVDGWRELSHRTLVTDELGVVILSSDPALRYRAAVPLDAAARARLSADRRYAVVEGDLLTLPIDPDVSGDARLDGARQLAVSRALVDEPWTLHLLVPGARLAARAALAAAAVAGIVLIALLLVRLFRQRRRLASSEQRAARELEHLVTRRTVELETAQRALIAESNFAMLGRMSAAINHEINQPLASLRLDLATLRTLTAKDDPPLDEIRETVVDGDRTTRRIARVIETLRSVARQPGGTSRTLDARQLLDDVVATVRRERAASADALVVLRPVAALAIEGNAVLLEQALLNLLHNAFDAVAGGGSPRVVLTLERAETERGERARFIVEDDGPGIDPAIAERLFEPFASSPARAGGLGLGLTLARQIAVDHDGELRHRSGGRGSRFELQIPLASAAGATGGGAGMTERRVRA